MWEAAGFKTSWYVGRGVRPGRRDGGNLHAWYYARYLDGWRKRASRISAADVGERRALRHEPSSRPFYRSGGRPWDLVMDVWRAGAPRIDMLSPDIYSLPSS